MGQELVALGWDDRELPLHSYVAFYYIDGGGDFKIAIVTRNFTNPYWAALRDGALAEGQRLGVKVTVQAGQSETDADGEKVTAGQVQVADLFATFARQLGLDRDKQLMTPLGRPLAVVESWAKPIHEVLAG